MQQVESGRIEPSMEVREEVERLLREQLAVTFPDGSSDLDARRGWSFHESVLDERPARPRALSYLRTPPMLGVSLSGTPKDARLPVHSTISRVVHVDGAPARTPGRVVDRHRPTPREPRWELLRPWDPDAVRRARQRRDPGDHSEPLRLVHGPVSGSVHGLRERRGERVRRSHNLEPRCGDLPRIHG